MEEENQNFVTKKIEQPILDTQIRETINRPLEAGILPDAQGGFYQTNKFYIWAVVLGAVIIAVLAYFAFRKPPTAAVTEAKVEIQIDTPASVPSGGDAVYSIKLINNDGQKLTQVRLELAYPDGVSYLSSVPKADNLSGSIFNIPDLISGQNAAVVVRAHVSGNVGDSKQLVAKLYYHFSNFNSEFEKEKAASFTLAASDVSLELSGPDTVSNAQLVAYTVKYKNNSGQTVQNARIRANFPDGFVVAQADPSVSLGTNVWDLGQLNPGDSGQIQIQGSFKSANPGESKTWNVEFLVLGQNGEYNTQTTANITTAISSLPLLVSQQVSASGNQQSQDTVNPGDTLQFTLTYQNNSSVAATGINIIATLTSKALDFSTIQAEGGQVNNNTIIWSASGVPNLEILNPSESGTLRFSVRVKDPASKDSSTNLTVLSEIKIKSNEAQSFFPGNSITLKVSSPVSLNSQASYLGGSQPPKVGQATQYKIHLALTNFTNNYDSGVLTAFVPLGTVSFDSQSVSPAESANVQFDPSTGKLTWNVGVLPANAGRFAAAKALDFNLKLIPSENQAGQSPQLLKNIVFGAKDSFTGQPVQVTGQAITTQDAASGFGSGTVSN